MEKRQIIKCKVESCKFQDSDNCTLKEILVSSSCNEATEDKETLCKSFECDKEKTETSK